MTLVPKREYLILLVGDLVVFTASLWLTLFVRYLEVPTSFTFTHHLIPFSLLFALWSVVYFVAGLYGRHTRLFRSRLPSRILYTQTVNIALAALFFFVIAPFGLAPKTILVLYLAISFPLIFVWRALLFPRIPRTAKLSGVLFASGKDATALIEEVKHDPHPPFQFAYTVDTSTTPNHEIIQRICRVAEERDVNFLIADFSDTAVATALPILYGTAFHKRNFALVEAAEVYEEMFERVPLSFINYEWILARLSTSRLYDVLKRALDVTGALAIGLISLVFYPFTILAIKLDDGGEIFITQERVGRYQHPIKIVKFRSMSGNDEGKYGEGGKTKLHVTRVGKWLRMLRIDELPQIWSVLKGDLSLVGPRPELPALANQYSARIPYYNARHLVAPGLMGWAQLKHDRHPHHGADMVETKEKLSYDLYYLEHRSLLLDIFILIQTIRIVLTARGS